MNNQVGDSMGRIFTIILLIAVFSIFVPISDALASTDEGEFKIASQLGNLFIETSSDASSTLSNIGMGESVRNVIDSAREFLITIFSETF